MKSINIIIIFIMLQCNYIKLIGIITVLVIGISSCNRDEVFEKEQYKNVFALISESDNVSRKFHKLGEESVGYISASLGGTKLTEKDIHVQLVEDQSIIEAFNKTNYDTDVSKYISPLPINSYNIDSYDLFIPAGEIGGRLPIRIRPDGLSPDSAYFVALRVDNYTTYEVNPEKSYVLYRVQIKNWWAIAGGSTIYSMRAKLRVKGSSNELEIPGTKIMHPLTKNSVRIMAGNEIHSSDVATFKKSAIILEIDEQTNKITIKPYKDIIVSQVDDDKEFPNIFKIENDGFKTYKTFLLRYDFTIGNTSYEIKEELRLEYS